MRHTGRIRENESQTLQRMTNSSRKKKKISKKKKGNKNYLRGYRFELRVKKHFEKNGYYVVRKYASKGFEDLLAIKSIELVHPGNSIGNAAIFSEVFLIQCKNLKVERPLKKKDKDGLKKLAVQCGATPLLATNPNHKLTIVEVE